MRSSLRMVSRTEIIVDADGFDEAMIKKIWKEVCGDNIATMRIAYEKDGGAHLLLYPFKAYNVEFKFTGCPKMQLPVNASINWIRRLCMQGGLPYSSSKKERLTQEKIIERYWMPIRKARGDMRVLMPEGQWHDLNEEERADLSYIAMYIVTSKSTDCAAEDDGCRVTEMEFCADGRVRREVGDMSPDDRVAHMLYIATGLLAESLRETIEKASPRTLTAAAMMNDLSAEFAIRLADVYTP